MPIIQRLGSASARGFGFGKTGVTYQRAVQESASILDVTSRIVSYDSIVDETSTATDAIANLLISLNQVLEAATGSDVIEGDRGFLNIVNETATISDLISTIGDQTVITAETTTATDAVANIGLFNRSVTETASTTDTPQGLILTTNDIVEAGTASDVITPNQIISNVVTEITLGDDEIIRLALANRSIEETATVSDITTPFTLLPNIASETITITDDVAGTKNYWITLVTESSGDVNLRSVTVDLAGNVYVTGQADTSSIYNGVVIMKFNNFGTLLWQRILENASISETGYGITADNSGNVYICADIGDGSTTTNRNSALIKYDTNGNLLFQSYYKTGTTFSEIFFPHGIALDASQTYVYTSGGNYGSAGMSLVKHNTSGTLQWYQRVTVNGPERGYGLKLDASGNILVTGVIGTTSSGISNDFGGIVKFNPSGAALNSVRLTTSSTEFVGIATDSSGNIYCVGDNSYVAGADTWLQLCKFDSSFNLLWTKIFYRAYNTPDYVTAIVIDSQDNIFIAGYLTENYSGIKQIILMFDVSGNLIWQRYISTSPSGVAGSYGQLYVDSTSIYLTAIAPTPRSLILKLPKDGSLTGTYIVGDTTVTYGVETLIESTTVYGTTVPTITNTTKTVTTSAGTGTSFASPLTSTTVNI